MTPLSTSTSRAIRRFTLMVSGEDAIDELEDRNEPRQGLPHERFLLGDLIPIAPVLLLGQSNQPVDPSAVIACLQPVHLHATRDHLILMGQNQINLTTSESAQLLQVALPLLEEDFQNPILYQDKDCWFINAGPFSSLSSYSVDQAHGRNIDWWMPRDSQEEGIAKHWRKLQNEIQMLWHIDPVNEEREQRGMPSINSIWISGIGKLNNVQLPEVLKQSQCLIGRHPILNGLARLLNVTYGKNLDNQKLGGTFAWLDQPDLAWPQLSTALINNQLDDVLIIDFPKGKVRERTFSAKDLHKNSWMFWKKKVSLTWKEISQS